MTSDPFTVADLLSLVLEHEPPRYDIGSEPAAPPRARSRRCRASPLDRRRVAPFYAAAVAGVPDADIARAAGVTVSQVRGWRLRLDLRRKPGTTTLARIDGALLSTPDLVRALLAYGRVRDPEPPEPKRVSNEELDEYLAARGLSMRQLNADVFRERRPDFARRPR